MLYTSIFSKHFTNLNLNTFVLENDFEYSPFLLTKIEHYSTKIFPPLLLAYTFDVLDHIRQHNQPNTIRYLLCTIYYARFSMHYTLCTMQYALCIIHYALCTMHLYVFMRIYYFIRIHTYLLFHIEIRKNPVILVLTRCSRRVE